MDSGTLRALPKVELHLHLIGALPGHALAGLTNAEGSIAQRLHKGASAPWQFRDFAHFCQTFGHVSDLIRDPEDLSLIVDQVVENLAAQQVRYAEVTATPLTHLASGIEAGELVWTLNHGRDSARRLGVELGWVFDFSGEGGPNAGSATLDWVQRWEPEGTVGFGVGGPERGVPRRQFAAVFERAHAMGLACLPHAGESTAAQEVVDAMDFLHPRRIGHGIAAATELSVMRRLADEGICLEICPTSNVRTGCCPDMSSHPLPTLLEAGVRCTLASDDPGFFGSDLVGELEVCGSQLGMTDDGLLNLLRTGIEVSCAPPAVKQAIHAELDQAWSAAAH